MKSKKKRDRQADLEKELLLDLEKIANRKKRRDAGWWEWFCAKW